MSRRKANTLRRTREKSFKNKKEVRKKNRRKRNFSSEKEDERKEF